MKRLLLAAAALAVPVIATSAQAASVLTVGSNNIKFQNFESVFHVDGSGKAVAQTSPTYVPVAGDYIVGIAQITTINSQLQDGTLMGVFAQRVGAGPLATPGTPLTVSDRTTFFDSTGTTSFDIGGANGLNVAGGEIFRFYTHATNTFNAQTGANFQAAFDSVIVGGSTYLSLTENPGGVNNAANTAGYEYSVSATGLIAKTFAGFNLAVNNTGLRFLEVNDSSEIAVSGGDLISNDPNSPPGQLPGPVSGVLTKNDAFFQSDIRQNVIGNSPFVLQSADPAFLITPVPAPASVWGGLALLGLFGAVRARKVLA